MMASNTKGGEIMDKKLKKKYKMNKKLAKKHNKKMKKIESKHDKEMKKIEKWGEIVK